MTEPGLSSLAPVIATLFVALYLQNVLVGLFVGVVVAALFIASFRLDMLDVA